MVEFPDHYNPAEGIYKLLGKHIAELTPNLIDLMLQVTVMNRLKDAMLEDEELTQRDTLNGCDSLGHMVMFHQVLGLPTCEVTVNTFSCGCLFGILGGGDFMVQLCDDHIQMFTDGDTSNLEGMAKAEARDEAGHNIVQRWINEHPEHLREHHGEHAREKNPLYNWNAAFDPEQKKHDDATEKLLSDPDISLFMGNNETGTWEKQ